MKKPQRLGQTARDDWQEQVFPAKCRGGVIRQHGFLLRPLALPMPLFTKLMEAEDAADDGEETD